MCRRERKAQRTRAWTFLRRRQVTAKTRNWIYFALGAAALAACSAAVFLFFPAHRGLLWLALYTIPSHMFVSPFPHEPVLLFFAKSYGATLCALASLAGCLISGVCDYKLLPPIMHHPRVRPKYANIGFYQNSVKLFRRSPFWTVLVAGATPFPFYPVKFLSICDHYPLKRYLPALAMGRTLKYWCIGYLGVVFRFPNWSLLALALAFFFLSLIQIRRERRKGKRGEETPRVESNSGPRLAFAQLPRDPHRPVDGGTDRSQCDGHQEDGERETRVTPEQPR